MYSKITVSNNFMEIQMGGGVFKLGNPEWRGAQAVLEIQVDGGGGGSKNRAFSRGGVDFFWNSPMYSIAFWCLIVVYCFFWLYCVTTVTPFIEQSCAYQLICIMTISTYTTGASTCFFTLREPS